MVDYLELSREHTTRIDVAGVWFNGLVVAKNLSRRSGGHWGQQQTVPDPMSVIAEEISSSKLPPPPPFTPH